MKQLFYALIFFYSSLACSYRQYDMSPNLIDTTYQRSHYYEHKNPDNEVTYQSFLNMDKTIPVVVHSHGCGGIGEAEEAIRDYYGLKYHVIILDFFARGDTDSSCNGIFPHPKWGFPEVVNPNRQHARLAELDSQIKWLRDNGFDKIIVTGHSEGGKTVQLLQTKVYGIIVHSMDCKSREFYRLTSDNRYLFLYSPKDYMLTGMGAYSTVSCKGFFSNNITEVTSYITVHHPFADPDWKKAIVKFLDKK